MFGLGGGEILLIVVFALLFIGPRKLPELARGLGRSLREFQNAKNELSSDLGGDRDPDSDGGGGGDDARADGAGPGAEKEDGR